MKEKIVFFCFAVIALMIILPAFTSYSLAREQHPLYDSELSKQKFIIQEDPVSTEITGYLLVHVSAYTPGEGLRPYTGANISVRGFFFSYSGETDEQGDCLFQIHTRLFRAKLYFIKVSIPPNDWLHTKINSIYIEPREIVYRDFLFIVL